jgi:oligoribonuclease NrnB/cAMP/cGMP phosphodiesterase (DHH superfamily)
MLDASSPIKHSSQKAICISHIKDVDGCISAALIRRAIKSGFLLTNYGNINNCLRNISNKYNAVYVCDLGLNETIIEEFNRIRQFADLTYIDHHYLTEDILKSLGEMGVQVINDLRDCASVQTFNLFKDMLPREAGLLASYAAFSDRLENGPKAKKIIKKHDRDFILFETMLLTYALEKANISLKKRIVRQLSNLVYPHQIETIPQLALEQADRISLLRNELPSRASKLGNVAYVEAKGGSLGVIANLLLDVCDSPIGICYETHSEKQISDLSIRSRTSLKIHLGKITTRLAKKLGGFGGGHPNASGARIPTSTLLEFIKTLSNEEKTAS